MLIVIPPWNGWKWFISIGVGLLLIGYSVASSRSPSVDRIEVSDDGLVVPGRFRRQTIPWTVVDRFELLDRRSCPVVLRRHGEGPVYVTSRDWPDWFGRRHQRAVAEETKMIDELNAAIIGRRP